VDNYPKDNWSDFLGFTKQEIAPVEPINKVVKRDGRVQSYDSSRIFSAIRKAIKATRGAEDLELEKELTVKVEVAIKKLMDERSKETYPAVEEIQDLVESVLFEAGHLDLAKAYILYRAKHETMRDTRKLSLDISETMEGYLLGADWRVKENANVHFSLGRPDPS
jgi:anaerobic ribonucleoside-triphosphate reductase